MTEASSIAAVKPALHDDDAVSIHAVDEPMLLSDPARPPSLEVDFQPLRLSYPGEWIAQCVTNHFIDSMEDFSVMLLPVEESFQPFGGHVSRITHHRAFCPPHNRRDFAESAPHSPEWKTGATSWL